MAEGSDPQISHLLTRVDGGDRQAAEELLPLVYEELRRLARARLSHQPAGLTLQPTALVHEAYLRLVGERDPGWNGRGHFFAAAALAMRRILVDRARRKGRLRHGGEKRRVDLDAAEVVEEPRSDDLLVIDEALARLEADDPRKGQIVNLRYFAGLTEREVAELLGISVSTVEREWRYCRRWLFTQLGQHDAEPHDDSRPEARS
ncbi:MAG: sigma-70 family RNA polymerase sigma factor [Phycisphaerales bacterium]|nr:sigma-70 family RNA polymerase sigma factor [Phycisphaerales bacterium]